MASENHSNGTLNFKNLQTEGLECSEIKVRWMLFFSCWLSGKESRKAITKKHVYHFYHLNIDRGFEEEHENTKLVTHESGVS